MKKFKLLIAFSCFFALFVLNSNNALSMENQKRPEPNDFKISLGLGLGYRPDYIGSDKYKFMPLPIFDVSWKDIISLSTKDGLKLNLLNQDSFKFGTSLNYKFKRKESENEALKGLGDLNASIEAGIFLQYQHEKVGFKLDTKKDVGNGHQGFLSTASISYTNFYNARKTLVNTSLSATFADKTYMKNVFGINQIQSNNSGYNVFEPNAGIRDIGFGLVINEKITNNVSFTWLFNYSRLVGNAYKSPIVKNKGSADQFFAGAAFTYNF